MVLVGVADFDVPFDVGVFIGCDSGRRLGVELGQRQVPGHGSGIRRIVLPCLYCLCLQLPHLWLHPLYSEIHVVVLHT